MQSENRSSKRPRKAGNPARKAAAPSPLTLRGAILFAFALTFVWTVKASPMTKTAKPADSAPAEDTTSAPAAAPDETVASLIFTGDIVGHLNVTNAAKTEGGGYDFTPFFADITSDLQDCDYLIGNLETVFAGGAPSGNPSFNSPDDLAVSLSHLGYDMLTTANNHCLDQGFDGLSRTLDVLDENGLAHVGTYRTQEEFDRSSGVLVADVGDLSVAFLDYTYGVNYNEVKNEWSVNRFNLNTGNETSVELDTERIDRDMEYARSLNTDLIIVCMHWGVEYQTTENADQAEVADYLIARGADAILGGHSHVPQPLEYRTVTGTDGTPRTGFVCFSLGNLISNQADPYTNITAALRLELTRDNATGEASVTDVTYTPLYLQNRGKNEDGSPRYVLYNILTAIEDYEGAKTLPYVDSSTYEAMKSAKTDLTSFFGSQWHYTGTSVVTAASSPVSTQAPSQAPSETPSASPST